MYMYLNLPLNEVLGNIFLLLLLFCRNQYKNQSENQKQKLMLEKFFMSRKCFGRKRKNT